MKSDLDKVITKSIEFTGRLFQQQKIKYIKQMCEKVNDPLTAPETYWKILNWLLSKKNVPAIPPLLFDGKIISNISQKSLISTLHHYVPCFKIQAVYQRFD